MDESGPGTAAVTDYELLALVDMDATPQGCRALEAVGVLALLDNPVAVRAGYSSLLVRDIAALDDEGIIADGFGAALGTMLSTADDILSLVVTREDEVIVRTIFIDSPTGGCLLDMTSYGVHATQPLSDLDLLDLLLEVLRNLADGEAGELPFTALITRYPVGRDLAAASVTVIEKRRWAVGDGFTDTDVVAWKTVRELLGRSDAEVAASVGARRFVTA